MESSLKAWLEESRFMVPIPRMERIFTIVISECSASNQWLMF